LDRSIPYKGRHHVYSALHCTGRRQRRLLRLRKKQLKRGRFGLLKWSFALGIAHYESQGSALVEVKYLATHLDITLPGKVTLTVYARP